MRNIIYSFIFITISSSALSQYRYDNTSFKTVYPEDLCRTLQNNQDYILLDVRSKGEHYDTSSSLSMNIGHLKNAVNIDIRELPSRLNELESYKDRPIFVYCSQSQRSRRASKMLADSGFVKVFNINGGLTTLEQNKNQFLQCPDLSIESNLPYQLITPRELNGLIQSNKEFFILDIRNDSVFNASSTDERKKAMGKFDKAVNIPLAVLPQQTKMVPTDKPILIVDDFGSESPKAAKELFKAGFTNVSVLFNGMDGWLQFMSEQHGNVIQKWIPGSQYHIINAEKFDEMLRKGTHTLVLDIRLKEEFNNQAKDSWRNIGNIKKAENIPITDLQQHLSSASIPKNLPIVVYSFSNSNDVFQAAKILTGLGYEDVNLLLGGLFNLRWKAANLKGRERLKEWVENVPSENE